MKKQLYSVLLAWLVFIGIDFLFHASLFASIWKEDVSAIKSLDDLALLIPAGYFSFLLLSALIGYLFFNVFKQKPKIKEVIKFGLIFSLLYALSNFFGLFSFLDIPLKHLLLFNFVYFIETFVVTLTIHFIVYSNNLKKSIRNTFLIFIGLVILGIIIQNI